MTPELASLATAAAVWIFIHLAIAGTPLRDRIVQHIGERAFRAAFAVASLLNIIWLGLAWGAAGPVRVLWHAPDWLVVLCMLLLIPVKQVQVPPPPLFRVAQFGIGAKHFKPGPRA